MCPNVSRMDWRCQLKLAVLIGLISSILNHVILTNLVSLESVSWWFDVLVFAGCTTAFYIGERARIIKCPITQKPCEVNIDGGCEGTKAIKNLI